MFVFDKLILRNHIFLNLIFQLKFLNQIRVRKLSLDLTLFLDFLGRLLRVVPGIISDSIVLELLIIFVRKMLKFKLLLIVFLEQLGNNLAVELLLTCELIDLLFLSVKNANEHIKVAQARKLHGLFEKLILSFGDGRSFDKFINYRRQVSVSLGSVHFKYYKFIQ